MKQNITESMFKDAFIHMGRKDNFSYDGLTALYEYLEDIDENYDLDVIALCCEYSEYENLEELRKDYPDIETMQDLENNTSVIKIDDERFIIARY